MNCRDYEVHEVGAVSGGEAYLLATAGKTALIDTGYAFCAAALVKNIEQALKGRKLDYILLTHSHYDHASGTPACRRAFPGVQVLAGEKAAAVFARPSAIARMRELNDKAAARLGIQPDSALLDELTVDRTVSEGDAIDMGAFRLRVYETQGHTRCSLSFFSAENGLLIASETLGLPMGEGLVKPGYLIGYQMTLDAIRRLRALGPKTLLLPHNGLYPEAQTDAFQEAALYWAQKIRDRVVEGYLSGKSQAELVEAFRQRYFLAGIDRVQVEEAFLLNAGIMVRMLIRECLGIDLEK